MRAARISAAELARLLDITERLTAQLRRLRVLIVLSVAAAFALGAVLGWVLS